MMSQCGYWIFPTMILIMISCSGGKNDKQTDPVMSAYEQEIFDLINQYRQENGKALLIWNSEVQRVSTEHNNNMAEGVTGFGHDLFEQRASALQTSINARSVAENVARGQRSAQEVVSGWLNSPGHKKNIDGEYLYASLSAQKNSRGEWYYTQIFCNL